VRPLRIRQQIDDEMVGRIDRSAHIADRAVTTADVLEVHILTDVSIDADLLESSRRADPPDEHELISRQRLGSGTDAIAEIAELQKAVVARVHTDRRLDNASVHRAL